MTSLLQGSHKPTAALPPMPGAALEIIGLFSAIVLGAIAFLLGWLTPNAAAALTGCFLCILLALSWMHLNQGRHPYFLFLGVLTLVQGGKLLAYCLGAEPDPFRIGNVVPFPFDVSRNVGGIALLCVALSAVCVYAPCRWNYRRVVPPDDQRVRQYLPYLYLLFYGSLPFQIVKNYIYYKVAKDNGGYLYFFANHAAFASAVPFIVRLAALITFPVFVAIFVFERRRKYVYLVTCLYLASSVLVLLLGSRMGTFGLLLTLWYVAGVKSGKKSRLARVALFGVVLLIGADVFQTLREDPDSLSSHTFSPIDLVRLQGNSFEVTEVAVKARSIFSPYGTSYLWNELQDAFVPRDATDYARGRMLAYDVTVFLSPAGFSQGQGTAGSYIAEAYIIGGILGVVLFSLLIGAGLHAVYRLSGNIVLLFVVAMILPDIIAMPRGMMLDWMSVLLRVALYILVLACGWYVYRLFVWVKGAPREVVATAS